MSGRGQYRTSVGASAHAKAFVHTLELKQRYDNATPSAMAALLRDLSPRGMVSPVGNNTWDVALKDGAWARLLWYPDWNALEVTVSDREVHRVDDATPFRSYDAILSRIAQGLRQHGVTAVGAVQVGSSRPETEICFYNGARTYNGQGRAYAGVGGMPPVVGLWPIIPLAIAILAATSLTPDDIARTVKQIGTGFRTLHDEVMQEAGFRFDPYQEASGPIFDWWKITGIPTIEEWQKFQADTLGSWSTRFFLRPSALKTWHERLAQLRDAAQKRIDLQSVAPTQPEMPLGVHLYEAGGTAAIESASLAKRGAEGAGDIVKYATYGLIGVGGLAALGYLASTLKKGKR